MLLPSWIDIFNIGEEFVKFIPLMFFLRVIYKFSNNSKLSVICSVALVMLMLASMHAYGSIMFIFALCIPGRGSIFEFYGYIKTKNILVPYLAHVNVGVYVHIIWRGLNESFNLIFKRYLQLTLY